MREFLFRGKWIGNQTWEEGYYVHIRDDFKDKESHRIYSGTAETYCGEFYEDFFEVDPETVGQWTGMYDNTKWEDLTEKEREEFTRNGNFPSEWNGKKIFEGDICRVNLGNEILNGYVEYDERCGAWRIIFKEPHCILFLDLWFKRNEPGIWCEVIGNRWDNPELLKDGE